MIRSYGSSVLPVKSANPRLQQLLGIMNLMSDPQMRKELDKLTTAQEVLQYLIDRKWRNSMSSKCYDYLLHT